MKNQDFADKELQRLQNIGKLKWDSKKGKWNKKFYPITDDDNNFIKWKFGNWPRKTCLKCNKMLETVNENPKNRQSKYCTDNHAKTHSTIISRAKKRFNLHSSEDDNKQLRELLLKVQELQKSKNPDRKYVLELQQKFDEIKNRKSNWQISIPLIYEQYQDKSGKLYDRQIKERVESKDIIVHIDGKGFPYTTKSRTL